MSRRKIELLRDEVVRTAREYLSVRRATRATRDAMEYQIYDRLVSAVGAHDAHLNEITNSAGEWVEGAPETSLRAAIEYTPRSRSLRRSIVNAVYNDPDRGLTTDELELLLARPHTSVSSAVNYLKLNGWLEPSGDLRTTRAGRDAEVMRLTPAALDRIPKGNI